MIPWTTWVTVASSVASFVMLALFWPVVSYLRTIRMNDLKHVEMQITAFSEENRRVHDSMLVEMKSVSDKMDRHLEWHVANGCPKGKR